MKPKRAKMWGTKRHTIRTPKKLERPSVKTQGYKAVSLDPPTIEDYWAGLGQGNSKFEKAIDGVARSLGISFDSYQYYVPLSLLESTLIDFVLFNPKKIAVFADGWQHQNRPGTAEQDGVRRDELQKMGWTVIAITEEEFNQNPEGSVARIMYA